MIQTKTIPIELLDGELLIEVIDNSEQLLAQTLPDGESPVWVELWPSSIALARWFWRQQQLSDKTILELGAGLGLPGIAAARKGARVTQTDYIPEAVDIARRNAVLNGAEGKMEHLVADWRDFSIKEQFDIITGSDFLYQPDLHPYLLDIFNKNLKPGGSLVIGEYGRTDALNFIQQLNSQGWAMTQEIMEVAQQPFNYKIKIFQLKKI